MNGQFSTRVIALMPVAIAINIVLGYTVQHGPQAADLPRLDRHDPRRRAGRTDGRGADRHL